jgi:hypothetical protein
LRQAVLVRGSAQTIRTVAEEDEETEIANDLKLLTDFGADVEIVGVEFG